MVKNTERLNTCRALPRRTEPCYGYVSVDCRLESALSASGRTDTARGAQRRARSTPLCFRVPVGLRRGSLHTCTYLHILSHRISSCLCPLVRLLSPVRSHAPGLPVASRPSRSESRRPGRPATSRGDCAAFGRRRGLPRVELLRTWVFHQLYRRAQLIERVAHAVGNVGGRAEPECYAGRKETEGLCMQPDRASARRRAAREFDGVGSRVDSVCSGGRAR